MNAGEPQFAIRSGVALLPRFARVSMDREEQPLPLLDPDGTVLVTGAATAQGAALARHLVTAHDAHHLLLGFTPDTATRAYRRCAPNSPGPAPAPPRSRATRATAPRSSSCSRTVADRR